MAHESDPDSHTPQQSQDTPETPPTPTTALVCTSPRPNRRTSRTAFKGEKPARNDPLLGFKPYKHKAPRGNSITPDKQVAFIADLAASGVVTQAARSIGVSLEALYALRNRKGAEGFARAWELALDRGIARLEDCALERAMLGEERVFVRGGEVVARYTHHNTALLMFLLKQRRRERYDAALGLASALRPGHPVYERMKREWEAERKKRGMAESEEIILSINKKIEQMRQNRLAREAKAAALEGRAVTRSEEDDEPLA